MAKNKKNISIPIKKKLSQNKKILIIVAVINQTLIITEMLQILVEFYIICEQHQVFLKKMNRN